MKIDEKLYKDVNYCQKCGSEIQLLKDREDKVRPVCDKCGWVKYLNPVPAAACVVLNEKNELLIIKRKFEPKAGEWALPSGYIEINQTPEETAVCELKEETNLNGEIEEFLDYFVGDSPIYHRILSFGFLMKNISGELLAGDDALEAKYVNFDELPKIAFKAHDYYIKIVKDLKKIKQG